MGGFWGSPGLPQLRDACIIRLQRAAPASGPQGSQTPFLDFFVCVSFYLEQSRVMNGPKRETAAGGSPPSPSHAPAATARCCPVPNRELPRDRSPHAFPRCRECQRPRKEGWKEARQSAVTYCRPRRGLPVGARGPGRPGVGPGAGPSPGVDALCPPSCRARILPRPPPPCPSCRPRPQEARFSGAGRRTLKAMGSVLLQRQWVGSTEQRKLGLSVRTSSPG